MSEPSTAPTANEPRRPPPDPSWRDRVQQLATGIGVELSPARVVGACVVLVVVGATAFVALRPASTTAPPDAQLPLASSIDGRETTTTTAEVVVQAAGAVVHPGVYRIAAGARVNDLVALAGGFAPDADPDRVELAAPLTDGERVYVPRVGEPGSPVDSASGSGASSHGPIDLNRASEAELESLPGIGPALAQAIIDYRSQHGGFRSVDELADVRGIGPARLDQLRPLVTV